jgi:hypothetical protein
MIDQTQPRPARKKTPQDASEFEREQLRFFLSGDDLATTLAAINPSLAWLPDLFGMKLIEDDTQLIWVERNFSDMDSVRHVVNNLQLFGPKAANFLEFDSTVKQRVYLRCSQKAGNRLFGTCGRQSAALFKTNGLRLRHN